MKREPAEPQGFIKLTGVGIPRLQAGEDVKIEYDDEREQQQVYAACDHEMRHCRSSKYFSAAATIQHCASNFSSFDNS